MTARAGTAYLDVEPDFSKFNQRVARYASTLDRKFDPIDLRVNTRSLDRDTSSAAAGLRRVALEGDQAEGSLGILSRTSDRTGAAFGRQRRQSEGLHGSLLRLRLVAQALAVIPAGQGLYGFAGGAVATTSALGPLLGLLTQVPAATSLAVQAIGTLQLATGGIGDAIKAAQSAQDSALKDAGAALDQTGQAAERVRTSELALADAQRQVTYAQEALTQARADARRELADLEDQAERGRLSEDRARLSLRRAQEEVRRLAKDPTASLADLEDARLRVREARQDLQEARKDAGRARADFAKAEEHGVKKAPAVVAAERQKADAVRARDEAQRQLSQATKELGKQAGGASAAVQKLDTEMSKLSPEAQRFAKYLISLEPELKQLRAAAGEDLFPGVESGIESARRNLPVVERILRQTGGAFGDVTREAGDLVGSDAFGRDLAIVGKRNAGYIEDLGDGTINVANAIRHLLVASGPFTDWLVDTARGWAANAEESAEAGRRTGETAEFLDRTRTVLERLFSITGSVASGLKAIGDAGWESGDRAWVSIDRVAQRFEDWAESAEGQDALRDWFADSEELASDVIRELDKIGARFDGLKDDGRTTFDALAITISETLMRAISESAGRIAEEAPTIAEAFIRGFIEADAWGRLLVGAWLLSKFGGLGAFTRIGTTAGVAFGGGMAAGAATAAPAVGAAMSSQLVTWTKGPGGAMVAQVGQQVGQGIGTGVANSGLKGRLTGMLTSWGPALALAAAAAIGPDIVKQVQTNLANTTGDFELPHTRPVLSWDITGGALQALLGNRDQNEERLRKFGDAAEATFKKLQKAGDARGLSRLAEDARSIAREFPKYSSELGRFADAAEQAAVDVAGSFRDVARLGGKSLRDIKTATAETAFTISNELGPKSAAGKEALSKNYAAAARAIQKSMDAGVISTKTGTREIEKYMVLSLQNLGFTKEQAIKLRKGQDPVTGKSTRPNSGGSQNYTGKQRGGLVQFGQPGDVGPDSLLGQIGGVDVAVAPGEVAAVFNRHQLPIVNSALSAQGYAGLSGLFSRVSKPHQYAAGGIVPIPGMPGESIHSSILGDVQAIIRKYRALVTDGYATSGHAADGEHPKGLAVDLVPGPGGSWDRIDQLARWAEPQQNQPRHPFRWVGYTGDPNHGRGNHLHLSWLAGAVAGAISGPGAEKLKRVLLAGPDSPLKAIAQGALDTSLAAAQAVVDQAVTMPGATSSADISETAAPAKGALSEQRFIQLALQALKLTGKFPATSENARRLLTLAKQESSLIPSSINNWDSNAKAGNPSGGLMHTTEETFRRFHQPGTANTYFDPLASIAASINYQASRYKQLVTHSPYALGGLVELLATGGLAGAGRSVASIAARLPHLSSKSSRGDKKTGRRWSPTKLSSKISSVTAASRFEQIAGDISRLGEQYDTIERIHGLTDEQATKTVAVRDATDAELAAHGLTPEQIQQLRTDPGQTVELLNPAGYTGRGGFVGGIQQRVAEIDQLITAKEAIGRRIGDQQREGVEALKAYFAGIAERQARAAEIRERAEQNIERIRSLHAELRAMNEREGRAKGKAREALVKRHAPARKRIGRQIDALRDENQSLVGSRSVDVDLSPTAANVGGKLRSTLNSLKAWEEARDELAPDLAPLAQRVTDTAIDVEYLRKERREWVDTVPPQIDVPTPDEPAKDSRLEELLEEWKRNKVLRETVDRVQGEVITGFPFAGVFHEGGVVPGPRGAEQLALVQGGEVITSLDDVGRDGPSVRVVVEDHRVRVFVDDVEQIVDQRLRDVSRQARRALPGGGGNW